MQDKNRSFHLKPVLLDMARRSEFANICNEIFDVILHHCLGSRQVNRKTFPSFPETRAIWPGLGTNPAENSALSLQRLLCNCLEKSLLHHH
jgi:hypothetical protein